MRKRFQTAVIIVMAIALAVLYYFRFSSPQVVYVDSRRLINEYKGMIEAKKAYQQKSLLWKANIDTLATEVQESLKNYEKEIGKMTAREKQLSEELLRTKQQQLMDYQKAINEKAASEDSEMTARVLEQINVYIQNYGKEYGYKIIFAATQYGNIAYAEEGTDITDKVLEGLNKQYAGL